MCLEPKRILFIKYVCSYWVITYFGSSPDTFNTGHTIIYENELMKTVLKYLFQKHFVNISENIHYFVGILIKNQIYAI